MRVAGEAHVRGLGQVAFEHVAGIGGGGFAVGREDVAEHPRRRFRLAAPGQDLEGGGVRLRQHVGFEHPGQALNGGTVKAQPLLERALHFGRGQRHGLQRANDVGEPQPHEPHVALFDRPKDKLLLAIHTGLFPILSSVPRDHHAEVHSCSRFTLLIIAADCCRGRGA